MGEAEVDRDEVGYIRRTVREEVAEEEEQDSKEIDYQLLNSV